MQPISNNAKGSHNSHCAKGGYKRHLKMIETLCKCPKSEYNWKRAEFFNHSGMLFELDCFRFRWL